MHQTTSIADYNELFDQLVHQLLAHKIHLTLAMITTRFIDGLKGEIKIVVIIQHPINLYIACSLATLLEDILLHTKCWDSRKPELSNFHRPQCPQLQCHFHYHLQLSSCPLRLLRIVEEVARMLGGVMITNYKHSRLIVMQRGSVSNMVVPLSLLLYYIRCCSQW